MFDKTQEELERLAQTTAIPVSMPSDDEGYFDQTCPSKDCGSPFKIFANDWRDKVQDDAVFCPFCRHSAAPPEWFTDEQRQHARELALSAVVQRIRGALRQDARDWNRQQPNSSLIKISMQLKTDPEPIVLPLAVAEPMRLKISCPKCQCRYAVVGAAFFCPACGHNAADMMFDQSLVAIQNTLSALPAVRAAIPDRDAAETTVRQFLEGSLQNIVGTFQRYVEVAYSRLPTAISPRRNAFQNLSEGSALWQDATGKQYTDYLSAAELGILTRYFQQRHLLAHTQGVVDADYLARSGDTSYQVGQRLVIREPALRECIVLVRKLAHALAK